MNLNYTNLLEATRQTTARDLARVGAEIVWRHTPVSDRTGTPTWCPMVVRDGRSYIPAYSFGSNHVLFDMLQGGDLEAAIEHAKAAVSDITGAVII